MIRLLLVVIGALLLGIQVVRNAAANASVDFPNSGMANVWADHPLIATTRGMTAIAEAARHEAQVEPAVIRGVIDVSRRAPLLPEPFLVRGVQAQLTGDARLAERAFSEAKWRDGRSLPARYFLAEHYFRRGDASRGLREIAVLARLLPDGIGNLAPYVASYARDRSTWPELRRLFREQPRLEQAVMRALATDASNAGTVLALSDPRSGTGPEGWIPKVLERLVAVGQYDRARSVWEAATGARIGNALIFDPGFKRPEPLAPFDWLLVSSTVGFAERQSGGGLHVIYYGQEDGALASQLLLLKPGTYRFTARASGAGANGDAIQWRVTCASTGAAIATMALGEASRGGRFQVPASCPAQKLELVGTSSDVPSQTEATIAAVDLRQDLPNG